MKKTQKFYAHRSKLFSELEIKAKQELVIFENKYDQHAPFIQNCMCHVSGIKTIGKHQSICTSSYFFGGGSLFLRWLVPVSLLGDSGQGCECPKGVNKIDSDEN